MCRRLKFAKNPNQLTPLFMLIVYIPEMRKDREYKPVLKLDSGSYEVDAVECVYIFLVEIVEPFASTK